MSSLKNLAKWFARAVLGDFSAYFIYLSPPHDLNAARFAAISTLSVDTIDERTILSSTEPLIRDQASYLGEDAYAYACWLDGRLAGVCVYWFGARYLKRNFWPLRKGEAKLVQIVSVPELRGRGVASALIAASCRSMMKQGFHRAYARIWHSNVASIRAFERAGWTRIALVIDVNPFRQQKSLRFRLNWKSKV